MDVVGVARRASDLATIGRVGGDGSGGPFYRGFLVEWMEISSPWSFGWILQVAIAGDLRLEMVFKRQGMTSDGGQSAARRFPSFLLPWFKDLV